MVLRKLRRVVDDNQVEGAQIGGAVDGIATSIQSCLRRLDDLEAKLQAIGDRLDGQRAVVEGQGTSLIGYGAWLADLQKWMTSTVQTVSATRTLPPTASPRLQPVNEARLYEPTARLERLARIWTVMTFLAQAEVPEDLLISVILPTRNRRHWLERAIGSVAAQTYANWELVVVDDASDDDTPGWLAGLYEPRLRILRTTGVGAAAARNIGLDVATGNIVAYLDDDNVMHPGWLKAVAWAFSRWTGTESLYGARIIEDDRTDPMPGGAFPSIEFLPYDRERLEQANFIDQNVLAHRAGLPEALQDPTLSAASDWDVALRISGRRPPLELPALGCIYSSGAPGRLSETDACLASTRVIRARVHTTRTFRLLAHGGVVRARREPGVEDDVRTLRVAGASVAVAGGPPLDGSPPPDVVRFSSLEEAVGKFKPDLVLLYDADTARCDLDVLDELGIPFVLRVTSSDDDPSVAADVRGHTMCAGVWTVNEASRPPADLRDVLTRWRLRHI